MLSFAEEEKERMILSRGFCFCIHNATFEKSHSVRKTV
jgi:hypothetical protein